MFTRLKLYEEDGKPVFLRYHMLRRWLGTQAKRVGMPEWLHAYWAHRDVVQNARYYYPDLERDLQQLEQAGYDGAVPALKEEIDASVRILPPDKFLAQRIPTMHDTEYGRCVRDWAMLPCQAFVDCLNCNSHVCRKEIKRLPFLKEQLREAEEMVAAAEAERREAEAESADIRFDDTDPWMTYWRGIVERLRTIIGVFENPDVPDGEWIWPNHPNEASQLRQLLEDRAELDDDEGRLIKALLTSDNPRKLLKGK